MFLSYEFQTTLMISKSVIYLSYVFKSTFVNFWIYTKIIRLHLNLSK